MARFLEGIIAFIHRKASARGRHHGALTFLWGFLFLAALLTVVLLALGTDRLLGLPAWPPRPLHLVPALPLLVVGLWLWLWSAWTFFRSKGTPVPVRPPPRLVDSGPYAYSRNPMLSGIFLLFFGIGLLLRSLSLVALYTPLLILAAFLEFKLIEEPELVQRIGAPYVAYRKKVPMFFPYRGRCIGDDKPKGS